MTGLGWTGVSVIFVRTIRMRVSNDSIEKTCKVERERAGKDLKEKKMP